MGRTSLSRRHIRKLGTIGNSAQPSYYITLPIQFVRDVGWGSGESVKVKKHGNKLILEKLPSDSSAGR